MQRHHYVPQFYFKKWYLSGKSAFWLHCLTKHGDVLSGHKSARSIGFRNGLYSIIPELLNGAACISNDIENKFFSRIDSDVSLILDKILANGVGSLTCEERCVWCLFVDSILKRNPERIDENIEYASSIAAQSLFELAVANKWNVSVLDKIRKTVDVEAIANNVVLLEMVKEICKSESVATLFGMRWLTIQLPDGKDHFITCDYPILVNGASDGWPIYLISMAISPDKLLVMHIDDENFDEEFIRTLAVMHNPLIAKRARKYLISSKEMSDEGFVKNKRLLKEVFKKPIL
ncbi:DUF4238 domain-containing protein [Chitinibacter sp. S2-10]|uniref:DUF4238 domain-containing protein n=1 Tax=Chitinibacter sp. S2-10 TaxID=3373597 RepID=UPI0039773D0D